MKYFDKKALKDFELVLKENKPKTIKVVDKLVTPQKTTDDSLQDYLRRCLDEEKQQNDISVITQEKLPIITENTVKNSIENLPKVTVEENLLNKKANDQDYYPNAYAFKCTLCDKNIGEKKGITLQNCLHNFCLSCLEDIILDNSTPEVQCPFNEYECEENLLDSEIKALTSEEGYNLYLDRSLTIDQLLENYHDSQFPKWLCKTCGQSNSDEKARCAFCDIAKPKSNVEKSQYEQLLTLEESELDLIESYEDFECPICFVPYGTGEGFMLRECLHVFCKGCLSDTITNSEVPQIKCPYMDNDYSCDCFLQDREIRSAITIEDYDKYLKMSLNMAEKGMKESYHCLTVDCHGWWINEEEANAVHCPVCRIQNCLNCNTIHTNLNCKEYQDRLYNAPDKQAQRTKELIEDLLQEGVAMKCPQCGIIIQRNEGCDWMTCTMCLTEICWATKGPRWGPAGKGDISGGCKCTKEKRCAPQCKYCH